MRWLSSFAGLIHRIFCLYTLFVFALCYWVFSSHWMAGFLMMSLPAVLVIHLVVVVFGLILEARKIAFLSMIMLLTAYPFWSRTVGFRKNSNPESSDFRLLNYNVHQLGFQVKTEGEPSLLSTQGLNWLKETDPGILCLQEIYQDRKQGSDLVAALDELGYRHFLVINHKLNQKPGTQRGLAVFSKYRIINPEQRVFDGQNGLLKADILIDKDTITVINVHLQSMTLNLRDLVDQREVDRIRSESHKAFSLIKMGFERRNEQINLLEEWVEKAEHPVVVCGDFNEIPYSYSYGRLSGLLKNSFESGGSGFGFSYRKLPYFIRIDNQFYDPDKIRLDNFETVRKVTFSDHYPLIGDYTLTGKSKN